MMLPGADANVYCYLVDDDHVVSIKDWLSMHYDYSSRLLRQIKKSGHITKNGKECLLIDPVCRNDRIEVRFPEEDYNVVCVDGELDIVYENDEVLIVNKPPNMVTHPTKSHQLDTLANRVAAHWNNNGTHQIVRFLNRLDRDTSGLVVIAKNKYVHHYVQSKMTTEAVQKTYRAFVHGIPSEETGIIDAPIKRVSDYDISREVDSSGKRAITHYRVLEKYKNTSLLELKLETGRTHQIRVHLQYLGHSIIGDSLYRNVASAENLESEKPIGRQALHAVKIALPLPKTGICEFCAPLTKDLINLHEYLINQ